MQDRHRWQEKYMRRRLESTTCLFIGTSLSDPNLLRYLYSLEPRSSAHGRLCSAGR